jgi:hypothetical protein
MTMPYYSRILQRSIATTDRYDRRDWEEEQEGDFVGGNYSGNYGKIDDKIDDKNNNFDEKNALNLSPISSNDGGLSTPIDSVTINTSVSSSVQSTGPSYGVNNDYFDNFGNQNNNDKNRLKNNNNNINFAQNSSQFDDFNHSTTLDQPDLVTFKSTPNMHKNRTNQQNNSQNNSQNNYKNNNQNNHLRFIPSTISQHYHNPFSNIYSNSQNYPMGILPGFTKPTPNNFHPKFNNFYPHDSNLSFESLLPPPLTMQPIDYVYTLDIPLLHYPLLLFVPSLPVLYKVVSKPQNVQNSVNNNTNNHNNRNIEPIYNPITTNDILLQFQQNRMYENYINGNDNLIDDDEKNEEKNEEKKN